MTLALLRSSPRRARSALARCCVWGRGASAARQARAAGLRGVVTLRSVAPAAGPPPPPPSPPPPSTCRECVHVASCPPPSSSASHTLHKLSLGASSSSAKCEFKVSIDTAAIQSGQASLKGNTESKMRYEMRSVPPSVISACGGDSSKSSSMASLSPDSNIDAYTKQPSHSLPDDRTIFPAFFRLSSLRLLLSPLSTSSPPLFLVCSPHCVSPIVLISPHVLFITAFPISSFSSATSQIQGS
eukprot:3695228-Rhodomonas_salina.1